MITQLEQELAEFNTNLPVKICHLKVVQRLIIMQTIHWGGSSKLLAYKHNYECQLALTE